MFIVYRDNDKHSIWKTKQEAIKQMEVLRDNGYRNFHYDEIETNSYENGHYFV